MCWVCFLYLCCDLDTLFQFFSDMPNVVEKQFFSQVEQQSIMAITIVSCCFVLCSCGPLPYPLISGFPQPLCKCGFEPFCRLISVSSEDSARIHIGHRKGQIQIFKYKYEFFRLCLFTSITKCCLYTCISIGTLSLWYQGSSILNILCLALGASTTSLSIKSVFY